MSDALNRIEEYRIGTLRDLLSQCTEKQQTFFLRMYPGGIDQIPKDKISWAIQQCENQIKKNNSFIRSDSIV